MLIYSSQVVFEVFALAGVRGIVNRNVYTPNICGYRSLQILEKQWGTVTTRFLMLIRVCIYIYMCVGRGRGEEDGSSSGYKFTMFLLAAIFLHYTVLPLIADSRKVMVARHAIERFDFQFYYP